MKILVQGMNDSKYESNFVITVYISCTLENKTSRAKREICFITCEFLEKITVYTYLYRVGCCLNIYTQPDGRRQ